MQARRRNYRSLVWNAALHRANNFAPPDSDLPNSASEGLYSSNLPAAVSAWTLDDLLLCIRRQAPRGRWLLLTESFYGPHFSLAHQLFPGADSQHLIAAKAMVARVVTPRIRQSSKRAWLSFANREELRRSRTCDMNSSRVAAVRVDTTNLPRPRGCAPGAPRSLQGTHPSIAHALLPI